MSFRIRAYATHCLPFRKSNFAGRVFFVKNRTIECKAVCGFDVGMVNFRRGPESSWRRPIAGDHVYRFN
jgi:hypothetical protein